MNSQLKDKFEDGDKEKIEKAVQDSLGVVRQESEAEKYRNEDETNKAKIKAKNSLENHCFTAKNTLTEEKLKNKFARTQGRDAGHHEQVQGGEVRGQGNLEWNTDLIEMMELKHMTSQAAQEMDDGETRHESRDAAGRQHEEVQWTKHASRSDSQAQQHDLTSRGGVLEERVYARCPQHMSTTTNTAQPQGLALCSRCHPAWASEGTPVGPSKDTHGTLGPW